MTFLRRGLLLAAIAVPIYGAAVASASAVTFTLSTEKCNGATLNFCWNTGSENFELVGKQTITIAKRTGTANMVVHLTIGEEPFTIECEELTQGTGENLITQSSPLTATGTFSLRLILKKCKLTAPASLAKKCSIPTEKETLAIVGELTSVSELKLKPEAGEANPFIELEFKNNGTETCPSTFKTSTHALTGFQVLKVINPETPEETKGLEAVAKSGIKFAGTIGEITVTPIVDPVALSDKIVVTKTA